jgi:hypothetical protein
MSSDPFEFLLEAVGAPRAAEAPLAEPRKHPIDPLAQGMELLRRWQSVYVSLYEQPTEPPLGRLFVEKEGLCTLTPAPVLIVWRWLDINDYQDRRVIGDAIESARTAPGERFNCMVGMLTQKAQTVQFQPHATRLLTPFDQEAKAIELLEQEE